MPKGTKVHREPEVQANPYAVCQASTGQSFATGRPLRGKAKAKARRGRDRKRNWEEFTR